MSSSNPIIPPGSPLHRTQPGFDSKLVFTVCSLVAVHVAILAGLLIQGCQRQDPSGTADAGSNLPPLSSTTPEQTPPPLPQQAPPQLQERVPSAQELPPTPPVTSNPLASNARSVPPAVPENVPAIRPPTPAPFVAPIDTPSTPTPSETTMVTYVVKRGDTLTRIARVHHTTPKAVREANKMKTDRILVGQKLKIPQGSAPAQPDSNTAAPVRATTPNP